MQWAWGGKELGSRAELRGRGPAAHPLPTSGGPGSSPSPFRAQAAQGQGEEGARKILGHLLHGTQGRGAL